MYEIERHNTGLPATLQEWEAFTDGWLGNRRLSDHTRDAYRRALSGWLRHCDQLGLDPLAATFLHVNTYARGLEERLSPASVNQYLSGVSSWYGFLIKIKTVSDNPVTGVDRPKYSRDVSATVGLTVAEVDQLLLAADTPRDLALLTLISYLGLRVSDAVGLDAEDLTQESGKWVIRYTSKGEKQRKRRVPPGAYDVLRAYLGRRKTGPMFLSRYGNRLDRHAVFRLVQSVAEKAGLPNWADLSPHSLRHAFVTAAREAGVPLEDVQDAMGHADPRTTRRYDRDRHNLDRDPSLTLEAARVKRQSEASPAEGKRQSGCNETPTGGDGS